MGWAAVGWGWAVAEAEGWAEAARAASVAEGWAAAAREAAASRAGRRRCCSYRLTDSELA